MVTRTEKWLAWLLRLNAVILLLALPAVFLPTEQMMLIHRWLHLGEFPSPAEPLVGYLTRSLSLLYTYHGLLLLLLSFDVRRYRPVILLLGAGNLAFGISVVGIDLAVQMPWFWTLGEGLSLGINGGLLLALIRRVPGEAPATPALSANAPRVSDLQQTRR